MVDAAIRRPCCGSSPCGSRAALESKMSMRTRTVVSIAMLIRAGASLRQTRVVAALAGSGCLQIGQTTRLGSHDDGAVVEDRPGNLVGSLQPEPLSCIPWHGDLTLSGDRGGFRHGSSGFANRLTVKLEAFHRPVNRRGRR